MKRPTAILVLAFVLAVGTGGAFLASTTTCPDCDPTGRGKPSVNRRDVPGCPRCVDAGRVSRFNRLFRRDLDPDVALLIDEPWMGLADNPSRFGEALNRLTARAGKGSSLRVDTLTFGSAVFLDDGQERLPVAFVGTLRGRPGREGSEYGVFLFDPSGKLLDHVTLELADGSLTPDWDPPSPSGRRFRLSVAGHSSSEIQLVHGAERRAVGTRFASVRVLERRLLAEEGGPR